MSQVSEMKEVMRRKGEGEKEGAGLSACRMVIFKCSRVGLGLS